MKGLKNMSNFNFNHITLGGRLTATPELKSTTNGTTVCAFTVAVNRRGAKDQTTDFINCTAWKGTAEFISKYYTKGSSICVVGSLQVRSYTDKDGNKRTATDVLVESAHFVDGKGDNVVVPLQVQAPAEVPTEANFQPVADDADLPF